MTSWPRWPRPGHARSSPRLPPPFGGGVVGALSSGVNVLARPSAREVLGPAPAPLLQPALPGPLQRYGSPSLSPPRTAPSRPASSAGMPTCAPPPAPPQPHLARAHASVGLPRTFLEHHAPRVLSSDCLQNWKGLRATGGTGEDYSVDSQCPDLLMAQRKACAAAGLGHPVSTDSSPVLLANRGTWNREGNACPRRTGPRGSSPPAAKPCSPGFPLTVGTAASRSTANSRWGQAVGAQQGRRRRKQCLRYGLDTLALELKVWRDGERAPLEECLARASRATRG